MKSIETKIERIKKKLQDSFYRLYMLDEYITPFNIDTLRDIYEKNKGFISVYIRTASDDKSEEAIAKQIEKINKFCRKANYQYNKIYIDEGYSGSNEKRIKLEKILNDEESKVIIVSDLSILARTTSGIEKLIKEYNKKYIAINNESILKK